MPYMHPDEWLNKYIMQNQPTAQIDVYLKFYGDKELRQGKDWSHYGALKWRMPRDQKDYFDENDHEYWFDPSNDNYKKLFSWSTRPREL